MNERIKECMFNAGLNSNYVEGFDSIYSQQLEKFAELIVRECIKQGKQVQSQTVSNGSEDYNEGRKMGVEVFMNQIKKHFGVE